MLDFNKNVINGINNNIFAKTLKMFNEKFKTENTKQRHIQ